MALSDILMLITIALYMMLMVGIGVYFTNKNKSSDDFYLGGRKLGPFVTAMSAEASDMSSWLLMGLPGVALATGIAEAFWTALGLALGTYFNWLIVAKRIRTYSEKVSANTLPDFFANRFRDRSGLITLVAALIIIVFFVPYSASGFASVGKLFNSLFGVDYHVAMIVGAIVIVAYTVSGGFLAASTTDFIQSIIMTLALIVVVVFGISTVDGMANVTSAVENLPGYLSLTSLFDSASSSATSFSFLAIVSTLAWGLGYFGMPHILLRFMAIEDKKKLKLSRRIASVWVVISMGVAIFIGVVGYAMVNAGAVSLSDPERIIIEIAKLLSTHSWILAVIAGLIIAGILASIMSTSDSQLLAAASSVSENIVKRFFAKDMKQRTSMIIARATVAVIAVVSVIFAWNPDSSVFKIVSFAWAGFGAAFAPLVLFALFWKRTTKWGAFAGIVAGGVSVILWEYVITPIGVTHGIDALTIYELLPAFIISSVAIVVVSLLTKAPEQEIIDEFEAVKAEK